MDIGPITNLPWVIDQSRHDNGDLRKKRQPQRKREQNASTPVPVYTPDGELHEEQPPKIDVLV
jgi:hypothetical protein